VVYTASCGALAALEYLVHVGTHFPVGMLFVLIDIPDTLHVERTAGWAPADALASRRIGDEWVDANSSAVLEVPSVLMPRQKDYLLNPLHPDFGKIALIEQNPFAFDSRLLSSIPPSP
jgi:RES domain-containing protein